MEAGPFGPKLASFLWAVLGSLGPRAKWFLRRSSLKAGDVVARRKLPKKGMGHEELWQPAELTFAMVCRFPFSTEP